MDIAITGSSGLIGSALADRLRKDGHRVRPVVRRPAANADEIRWDPTGGTIETEKLEGVGAVVHLAGAGIGDERWTPERKKEIRESRTIGTGTIARAVADAKVPVLVSGSGVDLYGDRGDEVLSEDSSPGDSFLARVCIDWEGATASAAQAGARVACIRTSMVLTPRGGALTKLLPLFRLGLGGRMGSGRQWWSWISLDDEVDAIRHLLTNDAEGPHNLCAPTPVTNADFAKTLGRVLRRPAVLPVPSFGPRLVVGKELAVTLLEESKRAVPARLESSGYAFAHPTLETALRAQLRSVTTSAACEARRRAGTPRR
ncbi:MAG TPA: TIGR01777 family oxidoreductase [Acidimicrobiales bacterium]|nr:TIGR01777 family oxidoreductase [Acidimicrobiales bacterium]